MSLNSWGCGITGEKKFFQQGLRCIKLYELSVCDTTIPKYHLEGKEERRAQRNLESKMGSYFRRWSNECTWSSSECTK